MSCGDPQRKPFVWQGVHYDSLQSFAMCWGLSPAAVSARIRRGITDERLNARRIHAGLVVIPARYPTQMSRATRQAWNTDKCALSARRVLPALTSCGSCQVAITGK